MTKVLLSRQIATSHSSVSAYGTTWKFAAEISKGAEKRAVYRPVIGAHHGSDTILSLRSNIK